MVTAGRARVDHGAPDRRATRESGRGEDDELASDAPSACAGAHRRAVFHLYRWLCILVLVSANAPAIYRLDRCSPDWLGRCDSVCGRLDRDADPWLEFRSLRR